MEERRFIHEKPRIFRDRFGKLGDAGPEPSDFIEQLELEKRNRGHTPRPIALQPRKLLQTWAPEDDPRQELSVEQDLQASSSSL